MTKEERKEYMRKYRQEHKEELREYGKQYSKKYYQEHKEERREYKKQYGSKYRQKNKKRIKEYSRNYNEIHKDEVRIRNKQRYNKAMAKYKAMLGGKCEHCGTTENLQFHHVDKSTKEFTISGRALYKDTSKEVKKCILLCRPCHDALHAKLSREEKERKRAEQDKQDTSK